MADIKLLLQNYGGHDDDQDDEDDGDYDKYFDSTMERTNPDDLLTPLEKLRKYCTSENIFTRQMVARSIVETVQSITNEQECLSLLEIISKLSDDIEPSVRCELMEQLPPCCMMLMDLSLVPDALSGFVLPVMVKYLTDPNNQVRKLSQSALLQLMDQDLIHRDDVETQICPVLLQLTEQDSGDDFRTEAVALMTKITPLIGGEVTEKLFLQRFRDLCSDPLFHVRKVCASNFGDMTSVISTATAEEFLLPVFAQLCEDGVWGVRKACAETFMAVSGTCSRETKYEKLAPLFVGLLCDKSRWVQMAAYQALGQFIATFADPRRTGFDVNEDGTLVQANTSFNYNELYTSNTSETQTRGETTYIFHNSPSTADKENPPTPSPEVANEPASDADDSSRGFNNFEFWRTPLPAIEISDELLQPEDPPSPNLRQHDANHSSDCLPNSLASSESPLEYTDNNNSTIKTISGVTSDTTSVVNGTERDCNLQSFVEIHVENMQSTDDNNTDQENQLESSYDYDRSVSPQSSAIRHGNDTLFEINPGSDDNSDDEDSHVNSTSHYASSLVDEESLNNQKIVPPALLEHYISMTEPDKAQTIDGELPRHCAFTLPGVVLALGRDNWHLIKETYDLLSTDMQWKVRRTLAFSIHDLATILGQDICVADLVPIFNGFLKDLDEVRIGVLKHLFDFINILPADLQKDYLNMFNEFLKTDNTRNWRFRQDLAHQLMSLVNLYDVEELAEFFCPVSLELVCDKVAEVREYAFHLLCILMQRLCNYNNNGLVLKFATNIITLGTHHQHWVKRKACAQIYQRFLEGNWYDPVRFSKDFLPSLINLCTDVVPNVRLISSKALLAYTQTQYYQNLEEKDECRVLVERTLESLQLDDDQDVRYFSGGKMEDWISQRKTRNLEDQLQRQYDDGVRIIQSGIHEYSLDDNQGDDDDDTELVEEVYIEDNDNNGDEIVVEEYYVDRVLDEHSDVSLSDRGDVYVEEIIEEVIEHIGTTSAS